MASTFSVMPARAPDYVYRWPLTTRNLSQSGDAYNMSQATMSPDLSQAITNYQGASGTPVLSPPRVLTSVNEGLSFDLPLTAQRGAFLNGWRDTFASRILLRAEVFHSGTADARDGFGLVMSNGSLSPNLAAPSLAGALGGLWFRRPAVIFQWECERYLAGGALTGADSFQVNGELAAIEVDIQNDQDGLGATATVRAAGAFSPLLPVGAFRFNGVELPEFTPGGWYLSILQNSVSAPFLESRGSLSIFFD